MSSPSATTPTSTQPPQQLPSTTSSSRPTSTPSAEDVNRWVTRDDALALDFIWRIPSSPRSSTYPRSRFIGLNVRHDLHIDDPEPCNPDTLDILRSRPPASYGISCGLPGLDEALEVCDRMADLCSGVVDRNATYSWRDVNQITRFHVLSRGFLRPKNTSRIIDSFYAFYYPTELKFFPVTITTDFILGGFLSNPPSAFVSGIYGGAASRMPEGFLRSPDSDPDRDQRTNIALVVTFHIIGFILLLFLYRWAMGIGSRKKEPTAGSDVDVDLELEAVLSSGRREADQQVSQPPPIYSEAPAIPGGAKSGATHREDTPPPPAPTPAFTSSYRQSNRTASDHLLALDSIWRIPSSPIRSKTYPRSRFLALNIRYDLYIADPEPCTPSILPIVRSRLPASYAVSCGLPGLEEALEVCDRMAERCSGVVDRYATYSWRDVNQTTRFHVLTTEYRRPMNSSLIVDSCECAGKQQDLELNSFLPVHPQPVYAFYYPTETRFFHLTSWNDFDGFSTGTYRPKPLLSVSGLYSGSTYRAPGVDGYRYPLPDPALDERMRLGLVVAAHVMGFFLLITLYRWAVGIGSWKRVTEGGMAENGDVDLEMVSSLGRGGDKPELDLPMYSEAAALPAEPEPPATPTSTKRGAAQNDGVMYI
ncbi:hypothetical protein HDU96_003816 [Phlyctochytrium bullatum]|nr:hypothetical protein HDU96_003816 [Phlyctochytrium bullatum]